MSRFTSAVAGLLVLASSLSAQFPIGHATPIGPYTPSLGAEPLWLGNIGFGYRIQNAPPGGSAFVAVTAQRVDQVISGLQIYVDVANILITHAGPVDLSGQAFIPVPFGSAENPALAGVQAYAQAAVDDPASPGSFGTTAGLLLEVTLHPVWAYSNTAQEVRLFDALTATSPAVTGFPPNTTVADVTFANGGRDLFVATNLGLFVVDTLAPAPTAVALGLETFLNSLAWDRVHRRLYALSTYNGILYVVDGDRSSPTFGTPITQVSFTFPTSQLHVAVSADGSILALVQNSGALERRIGDPSSPSYLQVIPTPPPSIGFTWGTSVDPPDVSPDGRIVSIPVNQPAAAEIHRFDGATGQWIDYDPILPNYQPLKSTNHPGLPPSFAMLPFRDGTAMILAGSSVVQVDFDPVNPANVVVTTVPAAPISFTLSYLSVSPSGRFLVRRDFSPAISLVEVATGVVTLWASLPQGSISWNPPNAWR